MSDSALRRVSMKNELIRAAHGLTLMEKRLLMLAVSKLNSNLPPSPENMTVRLHVSEFAGQFGVTAKSTYEDVRGAVEHLMDRYIRFFSEDGSQEIRMQWVGRASYEATAGRVELAFWHELSPMLFELKSHFTSYRLNRAGGLRSVYAWRLFELLMQFKTTGILKISVEEFRQIMEVPVSYQKDFGLLRTKCVEVAVNEIREKDGLSLEWRAMKHGRKVKTLEFTFPQEQQTTLPLPNHQDSRPEKYRKPEKLTEEYIRQHARPGESWEQARSRMRQ